MANLRSQPPHDGALTPHAIDADSEKAIKALLREGSSPNTVAAYGAAIRYWSAWYQLRYQRAFSLPIGATVVMQFIVDHVLHSSEGELRHQLPAQLDRQLQDLKVKSRSGPLSLSTVLQRLSVLSKAHQLHGHASPCLQPEVRELVARTRRAYAGRGHIADGKEALTRDLLEKILETCNGNTLRDQRDRALLLFAWATGGRRRSEVVRATMENVTRVADDAYLYKLDVSKTNQSGVRHPDNLKPLLGSAAAALTDWLVASRIQSGALFRRVRRGGIVAEPLSAAAVRDIVRRRCALAGIDGNFSAHSLRSGFVTEAGQQNIPLGETMALTGHTSANTVLRYFRAGNVLRSDAARLFEARPSPGTAGNAPPDEV